MSVSASPSDPSATARRGLILGGLLALASCGPASASSQGARSEALAASRSEHVLDVACNPSEPPPRWPVRRLTAREYTRTVSDLFSSYKAFDDLAKEVSMELGQLPRDGEANASFSNMDGRTSQRHVDTFIKVAESVARAATARDDRLLALAGTCALSDQLDRACVLRFIAKIGRRVWRRPLEPAEVSRLSALAPVEPPREAYRLLLRELLAAPAFALHLQLAAPVDPTLESGLTSLVRDSAASPYALASRLSYHFWQTLPDERLLDAAASGALDTDSGYRVEVERLVKSQRARATWFRFFREWLLLDEFGGFSLDRAFSNFSGGLKATPELYDDAVWEIEQLVGYYTFDTRGSYPELLSSDLVVTRSPRLAALYGVEPWDGRSVPRTFPAGERSGLLTRAAVLISGSHATNPFHRGAFVRRRLLCEPIEPPAQRPPEAFVLPVFDPKASTRTRYEHKVENGGCKGCHELFSPYGYALEAYDALGRYRKIERLIDDAGDGHGRVPVDARAMVSLAPDETIEANGPVELSRALATSSVASACFARQYFRFTFRRQETAADACALDFILHSLKSDGLFAAYRDVAFSDAFRRGGAAASPGAKP